MTLTNCSIKLTPTTTVTQTPNQQPMKQVTFTVTLTFNDPIAESDIQEVADNVANAIKSHADSAGIAPEWPNEDSST